VDWSEMFQVNMQRATEINLAYLKNVTDIQTELAHAVAEQLPALNKQLFGSVDELVRATVVTVEDVEPRAAPAHRTRKAA
jgi:hypothetical protein